MGLVLLAAINYCLPMNNATNKAAKPFTSIMVPSIDCVLTSTNFVAGQEYECNSTGHVNAAAAEMYAARTAKAMIRQLAKKGIAVSFSTFAKAR